MSLWLGWLIALISTVACIVLWFWDVRKIMRNRESTVESAAGQLAVSREKARKFQDDPAAAGILERSEKIYRQAVELYNRTMKKPWIYLPAHLMGYQLIHQNAFR